MLVSQQWEANARGVAKINVNPNARSTGAATISINSVRHTSKAHASGRAGHNRYLQEKYRSDNSSQGQKDRLGSLIWSSKSQKTKTYIRETSDCHQGDELSLCPRCSKKDIHGGVGLTQMTRLKGLLIIPTLSMQRRAAK